MDGAHPVDDLSFRATFTGDGIAKLREKVTDKLKEFMGEYTDDTLVEYVIVLVKNGRRKDEARNELNVFLGDDSDSFVSWLWDHLGSHLDLYVQPQDHFPDEVAMKLPVEEKAEKNDSHQTESDSDKGKYNKLSRSRHNREWSGLVRDAEEAPHFRSSVIDYVSKEETTRHNREWRGLARDAEEQPHFRSSVIDSVSREETTNRKVGHAQQSLSPRPIVLKKRYRSDERQQPKRDAVSQVTNTASRRLLQFAVRDAVATSRPSNSSTEPASKRLRSVVSTSTGDLSQVDRPVRIRSVARVPNAMTTAIKAVAEAAKDVGRLRSSGNVFDRLGRGLVIPQVNDELAEFREAAAEQVEYRDHSKIPDESHSTCVQRIAYPEQYAGNVTMMDTVTGMASDSASDNEGYDDVNVMGRSVMDASQTGTSGGDKGDDSLMVQYSVAKNAGGISRKPWKDQDQPASMANTSSKIVNISVNVNTWKPTHYQQSRKVPEMDSRHSVKESEAGASAVRSMKETSNPVTVGNGNAQPAADVQQQPQKLVPPTPGLYSTAGRPTEDADCRTIFVNNVHFAATKDSLSRHFNKFGEVLKVVIVNDVATGQPKGSAYVEFMRKEAAEHALSLDGTSFMSRILKVVKKSSAQQESAQIMTWPHIARGSSPFAGGARFARVPFPRGGMMPSLYRPRPPMKTGARSLQWKRGSTSQTESSAAAVAAPAAAPSNSFHSPAVPRSLTYVRPDSKTNGNSGTIA